MSRFNFKIAPSWRSRPDSASCWWRHRRHEHFSNAAIAVEAGL